MPHLEEIKQSSTEIYDGIVVHLFRDTVTLPNGKDAVREVIRHVGAVCVVPLTEQDEVVCVRQFRYPHGCVLLEIPAGKLDCPTEDRPSAARRELREETGIVWEDFEEVSRTVRDCYATIFYSYLCTVDWPKDAITMQAGETEGYEWLSEEEFIELLNSGRMIPGQPERMEGWFRKMGYLK